MNRWNNSAVVTILTFVLVFSGGVGLFACNTSEIQPPVPTPVPAPSEKLDAPAEIDFSWVDVNDWLYQLQGLDLYAVGNSEYDLVVMDYSSDGTAAGEYSSVEIAALKNSPGGPKLIIAYLSIGEAEDYRYYWQSHWTLDNPSWLDAENPDWIGNYKVKYWHPEWQEIIYGYLDKIIEVGFDGVYLDLIDAYEYYAEIRPTAEQEMVDFVVAISDYARVTRNKPDFGVFPQNAAELGAHPEYLTATTGIGQEETYYGYDGRDNKPTLRTVTDEVESYIDTFIAAGKLVLTVEYSDRQEQIDDAYQRAEEKGYIPFCTIRDLDQLTINQTHEPD